MSADMTASAASSVSTSMQLDLGGARTRSVLGKLAEGLLHVAVPVHRLLRMPPAPLHRVARLLVGGIPGLLRFLEVPVLGVDDVVGSLAPVLEIAGSPQLAAGHGLHGR